MNDVTHIFVSIEQWACAPCFVYCLHWSWYDAQCIQWKWLIIYFGVMRCDASARDLHFCLIQWSKPRRLISIATHLFSVEQNFKIIFHRNASDIESLTRKRWKLFPNYANATPSNFCTSSNTNLAPIHIINLMHLIQSVESRPLNAHLWSQKLCFEMYRWL